MQQYFVNEKVNVGNIVNLDNDTLYHLIKVLRKDNKYTFRIADINADIYYAKLINNYQCEIIEKLDEYNELNVDVTCILSLIKLDKFELAIQKLVELGVKRIVPYNATRSVVKIKDDKKLERIRKIVKEAAQQSHRNIIPEVCEFARIKDLEKYKSKNNYICYEASKDINEIKCEDSLTFVIGPEGGFDENEYNQICSLGYEPISLGKRILRAETACMYVASVVSSKCQ